MVSTKTVPLTPAVSSSSSHLVETCTKAMNQTRKAKLTVSTKFGMPMEIGTKDVSEKTSATGAEN